MKIQRLIASIVIALFVAAVPAARGAEIDLLTLTPSGANTNFVITGTYPPNTAATNYSGPNLPYSVTFALPTVPSSLAFVDPVNGIFGIDTSVMVNGVTFANSQIAFFGSSLGGGLDVCLDEGCGPFPPTLFYRWVVVGDQLFTGSVSNPTFISGSPYVDPTQSFIEAPVPEPATLSMLALGALGAMARRRRKSS
jgi:hypothetical protein